MSTADFLFCRLPSSEVVVGLAEVTVRFGASERVEAAAPDGVFEGDDEDGILSKIGDDESGERAGGVEEKRKVRSFRVEKRELGDACERVEFSEAVGKRRGDAREAFLIIHLHSRLLEWPNNSISCSDWKKSSTSAPNSLSSSTLINRIASTRLLLIIVFFYSSQLLSVTIPCLRRSSWATGRHSGATSEACLRYECKS